VRAVLLAVTVVVLLSTLVWGRHTASLQDLQRDLASGRVTHVLVTGGLPAGAVGSTVQDVQWRSGWSDHRTQVQYVDGRDASSGTTLTGDDGNPLPVVGEDAADLVRQWGTSVRVDRAVQGSGPFLTGEVLGIQVPGWVGVLVVLQWLGALFLLVNGPDPRRVSRWGWFWLFTVPFGVTAFLVSSGPLPGGRPVPPGPRRLGGGWAFLLSGLLTGVLGGSGSL
jgi:hypothetical protein